MRRVAWSTALLITCAVVAACGRIGFGDGQASPSDGGADSDGGFDLDALNDPNAAALVLYFPFDDAISGTVPNLARPAHDATCVIDCPGSIAGMRGGAALFDGVDDALRASTTDPGLDLTAATIAFWVRLDVDPALEDAKAIVQRLESDVDHSYEIFFNDEGGPTIVRGGGDGAGGEVVAPWVAVGEWAHIAMTWDDQHIRLYFDGEVVDEELDGLETAYNDLGLYIGTTIDSADGEPAFHLPGALDDLRIYNAVISAGDIASLAAR